MVDVAQLVEHQIVALVAVGSIPTIHPILRLSGSTDSASFVWHGLASYLFFEALKARGRIVSCVALAK